MYLHGNSGSILLRRKLTYVLPQMSNVMYIYLFGQSWFQLNSSGGAVPRRRPAHHRVNLIV